MATHKERNDDEVGVAAESGLRSRSRKRRAQEDNHVAFGDAQANAYFNSRRIKRVGRKPTAASKKKGAKGGKGQDEDDDGEQGDDRNTEDKALVLPARGAMLAALKEADKREAERRSLRTTFALPRFDQVRGVSHGCNCISAVCSYSPLACITARCSTSRSGAASSSRIRTCSSTASARNFRCCR